MNGWKEFRASLKEWDWVRFRAVCVPAGLLGWCSSLLACWVGVRRCWPAGLVFDDGRYFFFLVLRL